jgi:hypothetical protein
MSLGRAAEVSGEPDEPDEPVADAPPLLPDDLPDADEPEPEPEVPVGAEPMVLVIPSLLSTARMPFEIVGTVWQFEDEGVKKADEGVMVSPTVYETGVPLAV